MNIRRPTDELGWALVAAMEAVGSPIGDPYIRPVLVESAQVEGMRQVVSVERVDGVPTAVQRFGLVDNNVVPTVSAVNPIQKKARCHHFSRPANFSIHTPMV